MQTAIPIIAFVALLLLLSGCTASVPQEKYDSLAASCEAAKSASAAALGAEVAKTGAANARLSTCTEDKQSLQSLLDVTGQENAALRVDAAVLANAREKTDLIGQYGLAEEYYLDAFGPGKIPNNARIKKVDDQVALLNDNGLLAVWSNVKNCQSSSACDLAKAAFAPYIASRTQQLSLEAAAIVGAKN